MGGDQEAREGRGARRRRGITKKRNAGILVGGNIKRGSVGKGGRPCE